MHMEKNSNSNPNSRFIFVLLFLSFILLYVPRGPHYEIVQKIGMCLAFLAWGTLYFPGIKRAIQKRNSLSPKISIESIDEIKKIEKERFHKVLAWGIIIIIFYILYILGIV